MPEEEQLAELRQSFQSGEPGIGKFSSDAVQSDAFQRADVGNVRQASIRRLRFFQTENLQIPQRTECLEASVRDGCLHKKQILQGEEVLQMD